MAVNPVGFVQLHDFGMPSFITARAAAVVSGGQFVYAVSGTSNSVSSGLNSFAFGDLEVNVPASGTNFPVGVAVHNAGSLSPVAVCVRGVLIAGVDAAVTAGQAVHAGNGAHCVAPLTSGTSVSSANLQRIVGRTLLSAGSPGYTLVHLNKV